MVQEGNGKDEMSFPSVGRKWKEILKFFEWEANGKELISFFQRKKEKGRKKLGKVLKIFPKWAENW